MKIIFFSLNIDEDEIIAYFRNYNPSTKQSFGWLVPAQTDFDFWRFVFAVLEETFIIYDMSTVCLLIYEDCSSQAYFQSLFTKNRKK